MCLYIKYTSVSLSVSLWVCETVPFTLLPLLLLLFSFLGANASQAISICSYVELWVYYMVFTYINLHFARAPQSFNQLKMKIESNSKWTVWPKRCLWAMHPNEHVKWMLHTKCKRVWKLAGWTEFEQRRKKHHSTSCNYTKW